MEILSVDYSAPDAAKLFSTSLHNTGFVVLLNHPLDWHEIEFSYSEWRTFFNSDFKYKYKFNPEGQDGYIPMDHSHQAANSDIKARDIKEVFQLYFPWGQYPQEMSDLSKRLFKKKFDLAKTLLSWIEKNLPNNIRSNLKESLSDMVSFDRTLYRAIHYPPLSGNEDAGAIRAAAHEDFDFLTLLPAATEIGLQVKDTEGNWYEVETDPKSLVINAGGMLQEVTNYYYKSTTHRVVNPTGDASKRPRLSLPLFLHPRADAYLSEQYPTVASFFEEHINKLALDESK